MMRLRLPPWRALVLLAGYGLILTLVGTLVASLLANRDAVRAQDIAPLIEQNRRLVEQVKTLEEANARETVEHRQANQRDHDEILRATDCIEQLALVLSDPRRDRTKAVTVPPVCDDRKVK